MIALAVKDDYSVIEGFKVEDIKPRPHHLLIRWPGRNETKGGIIIQQDRERMGRMNGIVLAVGPDCDSRIHVGQSVQFSFYCEKEFMGAQVPGDRDPVFFMREEDLIGITLKTGFDVEIQLLNGCVLTKPELKPSEQSGLITPDQEVKDTFSVWGKVVQTDAEWADDFVAGESVLYHRNQSEDIRMGDFSESVSHIIRQKQGGQIMAVSTSEVMTQAETMIWKVQGCPKYHSQEDGSAVFYVWKKLDWPASFTSNSEFYVFSGDVEGDLSQFGWYVRQSDKQRVRYSNADACALAAKR